VASINTQIVLTNHVEHSERCVVHPMPRAPLTPMTNDPFDSIIGAAPSGFIVHAEHATNSDSSLRASAGEGSGTR
jgi:hypothetical protein